MMCHMTVSRPNLEDASQSQISVFNSFNVMSCMEMCGDSHDQERKKFFPVSDYLHYTMNKRKKSFFH